MQYSKIYFGELHLTVSKEQCRFGGLEYH